MGKKNGPSASESPSSRAARSHRSGELQAAVLASEIGRDNAAAYQCRSGWPEEHVRPIDMPANADQNETRLVWPKSGSVRSRATFSWTVDWTEDVVRGPD